MAALAAVSDIRMKRFTGIFDANSENDLAVIHVKDKISLQWPRVFTKDVVLSSFSIKMAAKPEILYIEVIRFWPCTELLLSSMTHTKFHPNRPSEDEMAIEDFFTVITII